MASRSRSAARREALLPRGPLGLVFNVLSVPTAWYARLHAYSKRLRAARRLAAVVSPVFARRFWRRRGVGEPGARERALGVVLLMLHYRDVRFPAELLVTSNAEVAGPLLVVVRHSLLNQLLVSRLVRDGVPVSVVMLRRPWRDSAIGTDQRMDVIPYSSMLFRSVASSLRAGRVVIVAIDLVKAARGFSTIETSSGQWFVATQPIRLALTLDVPVAVAVHELDGPTLESQIHVVPGRDMAAIVKECGRLFGLRVTSQST